MKLSNNSHKDIYLLRVTTPIAKDYSFVFEPEPGVLKSLKSIVLHANQTINFEGVNMWIEFFNLSQDLVEGNRMTVTLHFLNGISATILVPVRRTPVGKDHHHGLEWSVKI